MSDASTEGATAVLSRDAHEERLRGRLEDRGFDPQASLFEGGPTLGSLVDQFRRISVLEVAPVPAIEWLKRTSQRLGTDREVQDILWRAYERQIRDELDHGAYWGEMFFMLTGEDATEMPWDGEGVGGSNVKLRVPADSDDEAENRTLLFLGSAFSLGLEGGFIQEAFPELLNMMKSSSLPIAKSFVPVMLQIGKDEARHVNIHKYVFHALRGSQGPDASASFTKVVNSGRRAFGVRELSETEMQQYVGREKPPTTTAVLGPNYVRLVED